MNIRSIFRITAIVLLAATLTACKSSEERAEEHFQSGIALFEQGDLDRAVVEFQNVFDLNPTHEEARRKLAEIFYDSGQLRRAYSQYLRLVEQVPDDVTGRLVLSELSFLSRNWEEFERHGQRVVELDAENPRVKAVALALEYRAQATDEDLPAMNATSEQATALQNDMPENEILRNLRLDNAVRNGRFEAALAEIDKLIASDPENRGLYDQRLGILGRLQDADEIEKQLVEMVERFDEDIQLKAALIRFHVTRGDMDKAETFLRSISDPAAEDTGAFLDLVRFIQRTKGNEAAREELKVAIAQNPNPTPFRALVAVMDFEEGLQDQAIAEMESILAGIEPSDTAREVKVALARMLLATENVVGARRLVEEVLAEDSFQLDALKMQARWQIDADDTDGAIANLRTALDKASEDTQAMSLMAEAYVRAGNSSLARDYLSLAVEASNNAPEETVRYARVLVSEERFLPAEDLLVKALRRSPGNLDLLNLMGELYIRMEDVPRAEQVVNSLRTQDLDAAKSLADRLEVAVLNLKGGSEEAMTFLEGLAQAEDASISSKLTAIRARLSTGDTDGALQLARGFLSENPEALGLRFAVAATESAAGNLQTSRDLYRSLVEEQPALPRVWLELARVIQRMGEADTAEATIDEGLGHAPNAGDLLWAKASFLEKRNDIDEAIGIYEKLYDISSNSIVVANNLASMLSTYRQDEESLERAQVIARRFRGTEIPAMQDTYGWIAQRRGETEEALPYLESAAAGLPEDPLVQYHLGVAYASAERNDEALAQFRKAIEIAGPQDNRPQIVAARSEIQRLESAAESPDTSGN